MYQPCRPSRYPYASICGNNDLCCISTGDLENPHVDISLFRQRDLSQQSRYQPLYQTIM